MKNSSHGLNYPNTFSGSGSTNAREEDIRARISYVSVHRDNVKRIEIQIEREKERERREERKKRSRKKSVSVEKWRTKEEEEEEDSI